MCNGLVPHYKAKIHIVLYTYAAVHEILIYFFVELPFTKTKLMLFEVIIMPLGILCMLRSSISFTIMFVLDLLSMHLADSICDRLVRNDSQGCNLD